MNDYEYEFKKDCREKKNIGRNAKYMNRTGKGPMRFPSDYLTNKEKKALNGPVTSYDMGKPISYDQLTSMPEDLQRLYLQGLMDKFHPSQRALAELFGTSKNRIAYRMREFGIAPSGEPHGGKNPDFDVKAWEEWIADGKIPDPAKELSKVDYPGKAAEENSEKFKNMPTTIPGEKFETETIVQPAAFTSVPEDKCLEEPAIPKISDNISFKTVAYMWSQYLTGRIMPLKPEDVAAMFAIIKMTDITSGRATKEDWEELSKYALLASQLF